MRLEELRAKIAADYDDVAHFMSVVEDEGCPWGGVLVENLDQEEYDSYGDEDSILRRIYRWDDLFVEFTGTRQSYDGEDWSETIKEVRQTEKTVLVWE